MFPNKTCRLSLSLSFPVLPPADKVHHYYYFIIILLAPTDGKRDNRSFRPPQIHYHLLCSCHVELKAVFLIPSNKVTVISLLTLADTSNHSSQKASEGNRTLDFSYSSYLDTVVWRVKWKGDRTVPCGAPVMLTTLTHSAVGMYTVACSQIVNNSGRESSLQVHYRQFLTQ